MNKPTREISDAWIVRARQSLARGIDSKRLFGTCIKGKLTITSEVTLIDGDRVETLNTVYHVKNWKHMEHKTNLVSL